MGINSPQALKEKILSVCQDIDFEEMTKDVRAFLFDAKDEKRIRLFVDYIRQVEL